MTEALPLLRRSSAEVAAGEDAQVREARLKYQLDQWNKKRAGKRRLCTDLTDEQLNKIRAEAKERGMTQQAFVLFALERELQRAAEAREKDDH